MNDVVSGEAVTYQYDTLNRLINSSRSGDPQGSWSQAFTFDGFGNLTQKTSSNAPALSVAIDPTTNRLQTNGAGYDANGNQTAYRTGGFAATYAYDVENRLGSATVSGTTYGYAYNSLNQRVFSGTLSGSSYTNELIYFYGADGKKLGVWSLNTSTIQNVSVNQWFGGRLLKGEDRLQSVGKYFPYGEDRYSPNPSNPANDQEKFATYTRDSASGLDYAMNRYYSSVIGRFQTPDPYEPSAHPNYPQSWNRYAYVDGDPVGGLDTTDLFLPSSGGGGAVFRITVTGYSRTGAKEAQIASVLNKTLTEAPTGDCGSCLTEKDFSAAQYIKAIIGRGPQEYTFGYGALNSGTTAAFVGNRNPDGTPVGGLPVDSSITVNSNGAFFNSSYQVGGGGASYRGGTLQQAPSFIMAHELAHEVGAAGFLPDAGSSKNEAINNNLIQQHCGKQIAGIR